MPLPAIRYSVVLRSPVCCQATSQGDVRGVVSWLGVSGVRWVGVWSGSGYVRVWYWSWVVTSWVWWSWSDRIIVSVWTRVYHWWLDRYRYWYWYWSWY